MEVAAPLALGVMLVISLLILSHNARRNVIRRRWLWPLMAFGPVGIPIVAGVALSGVMPSEGAATGLLFLGSGFCFAVWVAAVVGYGVFNATREPPA